MAKSTKKKPPKPKAGETRKAAQPFAWKSELLFLLPAFLLGVIVYLNTLEGAFVYDDLRQITRNPLIQNSSEFWRALTSDVWAFKGGGSVAASNYWRPTFVLWLIVNFKLFGIDHTSGWHLTNLLLNAGVIALAYFLLRRLNQSRLIAGAIVLVYALHPVHTETVAWISGSPDLLLALALLGSLWFVISLREQQTPRRWILALLLYAIALGAKEVAILFPLLVFFVVWPFSKPARAATITSPFALLALVYFILRLSVLGGLSQQPVGAASLGSVILSLPSVFAFYLRQIVFPYWIGPCYPLRPVTDIGLTNFIIPLAITGVTLAVLRSALRSEVGRLGFALFLLPLLPAMNISAFPPEQIVHDRYLYLPLLGFLMMVVPELAKLCGRFSGQLEKRSQQMTFALLAGCCVPLAFQTFSSNKTWLSEIALWEKGVATDPSSSFYFMQYGATLLEEKRLPEAEAAYNRSLSLNPSLGAYMGRARVLIEEKRYEDAQKDLRLALALPSEQVPVYVLYQTYEALAISYERQEKLNEALEALVQARIRLPQYAAALTEKLSVILYLSGKKEQALAELESHRAQARTELLPESRGLLYRLGTLYLEFGRKDAARATLQEYLSLTEHIRDEETERARREVQQTLSSLP